jgi:RNA polymerase sigma-70 factor (ECF subfamily)
MTLGPERLGDVLAAARAGEGWALAALWRDLHPRLFRYLRSQEPSAAEDLASEAWLGVVRGLGVFEGDEATLRGWAFTIARRRLIDHRRKQARRRTRAEPHERLDGLERPAPGGAEDQVVESLTALEAVDRIRALLTPEQTEVVILRVVGGFEVAEVARITGRRPGAVRALQHRALQQLARNISPEPVTD